MHLVGGCEDQRKWLMIPLNKQYVFYMHISTADIIALSIIPTWCSENIYDVEKGVLGFRMDNWIISKRLTGKRIDLWAKGKWIKSFIWYFSIFHTCFSIIWKHLKKICSTLSRCVKLGGDIDSEIKRRKRSGVTSPRGSEEATVVKNFSKTFVKNAF